ncbi:ABC transporter permease subunit, partial [Achromobacter mucicolens]
MTPIFDWSFALEILPTLGSALVITIQATVLGMLVAVTLGLVLAMLRRSRLRIVSMPTAFFIEFVRSTPLLVQMYFLFYVLPLTGAQMSPLMTGIVALGLHYATYCAEVYRA